MCWTGSQCKSGALVVLHLPAPSLPIPIHPFSISCPPPVYTLLSSVPSLSSTFHGLTSHPLYD